MRLFIVVSMALCIYISSVGQTYDVGGPVSFSTKMNVNFAKSFQIMPTFDLDEVIRTNAINNANKVGPYMFGYEHATSYSLQNAGDWQTLPNGDRVWQLQIKSANAYSLNFVFNDFYIPEGGHLHIYSPDRSFVLGAYTDQNNNTNNMLGSDFIKGDAAILEYYEPQSKIGEGRLYVGMIVHGYIDINNWFPEKVNESGPCNMDVICPDGAPWSDEERAVVRIAVGGGLCSGTLVNNTTQDGTPYILTANHCGPSSMGSAVFRFNYNSPICGSQTASNSGVPSGFQAINGSSLRANQADSDFGLVELNSTPPVQYNVYYAGWDNSGSTPQTGVSIHHPSGDVKKISFDDDPLQSEAGLTPTANSHWRIEAWERLTTTEGGSSGSGLWDENHRVIGQLHGGAAACGNSVNDYYGKFSMSWNGNGSSQSSQRLHDWLDPQNIGATTLDGWDPNLAIVANDAGVLRIIEPSATNCGEELALSVELKNFGSSTLTSVTINYAIDGGANQTYSWSGSLSLNASETVVLPSTTITTNGSHTFSCSVSNPNGQADGNSQNNASTSTFNVLLNTMDIVLDLFLDCYGEEVSWGITEQGTSNIIFSIPSSTYPGTDASPIANGTQVTENLCLENGCYTFTINDSYGDGMNGSQWGGCNADGDYTILDNQSNTYVEMTALNADYGNSASHDFCITTVGLYESEHNTVMRIYPNPASEELYVTINDLNEKNLNVLLVDLRGAILKTYNFENVQGKLSTTLTLDDLPKGVYFLKVNGQTFDATQKLVKN